MRDDKEKIEKILESIELIQEYTQDGKDSFLADKKTQDAEVRNYQVIGEAVKDLSDELRDANPDVDWRGASRFRDKVIHNYLDIDYKIFWDAVEKTLEPFREGVHDIHQRIIHKVKDDTKYRSKLDEKLHHNDNPRPN